jgi:hypothetical protein
VECFSVSVLGPSASPCSRQTKIPVHGRGFGAGAGRLAVGVRQWKEMVSRCEACEVLSEFQVR